DVCRTEGEVPHIKVRAGAFRLTALGQRDQVLLQMPADHDLRGRLVVVAGYVIQNSIVQQIRAFAAKRAIAFDLDIVVAMELPYVTLLEGRVKLELIDRGNDAGFVDNPAEVLWKEIGDTYRADLALLARLDKGFPGFYVAIVFWSRPV